jgi:hypothetical protein
MVRVRLAVASLAAVALSGCMTSLPTPDYVVKQPAPYRVSPEGTKIDNENYAMDAEGYRVNEKGERIGMIDVQAKTAGENSNAVAGYYISSTGQTAPGRVATVTNLGTDGPALPGAAATVNTPLITPAGGAPAVITPNAAPPPSAATGVLPPPATGTPTPLQPK